MGKICSVRLCLGLLAVFSIMLSVPSANGKPLALQGNTGLLDRGDTSPPDVLLALLLRKSLSWQHPTESDVELAKKLEELEQLEKLREQLGAEEDEEETYAEGGLLPPRPVKRACFWKYCV